MLKDENLSWKPELLLKSDVPTPENMITSETDVGSEANVEWWWWSEAFWSSQQQLEVLMDERAWIIQQTEQETDPEGLQRVHLLLLSTGFLVSLQV